MKIIAACVASFGLVVAGCTPAEQQVARDDGAKIVANYARCVITHAQDVGATAQSVALVCGVAEIPDALQLAADEIKAARAAKAADAGAP